MQKIKYLLICCVIAALVTSCGGQTAEQNKAEHNQTEKEVATVETETAPEVELETETETETEVESEAEPGTEPENKSEQETSGAEAGFSLTEDEEALYEQYVKTLDTNVFNDVNLVSIAKIFIQCGVNGQWEAEFGMYAPETLTMTKAEYQAANEQDIQSADLASRKDMADVMFSNLKDGTLQENGDRAGIDFTTPDGEPYTFRLEKSDTGQWLVKYNPFDEYAE